MPLIAWVADSGVCRLTFFNRFPPVVAWPGIGRRRPRCHLFALHFECPPTSRRIGILGQRHGRWGQAAACEGVCWSTYVSKSRLDSAWGLLTSRRVAMASVALSPARMSTRAITRPLRLHPA